MFNPHTCLIYNTLRSCFQHTTSPWQESREALFISVSFWCIALLPHVMQVCSSNWKSLGQHCKLGKEMTAQPSTVYISPSADYRSAHIEIGLGCSTVTTPGVCIRGIPCRTHGAGTFTSAVACLQVAGLLMFDVSPDGCPHSSANWQQPAWKEFKKEEEGSLHVNFILTA